MNFFAEWLIIASLMLIALASPGPDFVMAVRNSLAYSRKTGFFTAVGFGLGVGIHTAYCIMGIGLLISQSILAFNILKYIGAAYLVYIGFKALRSKGFEDQNKNPAERRMDVHWSKAVGMGFFTNVLNPKATMFFLALFTQVIDPHTPLAMQLAYALTCVVITILWFSFVSYVLTGERMRAKFLRFSKLIDNVCGSAMIALGLRLALTKATVHA